MDQNTIIIGVVGVVLILLYVMYTSLIQKRNKVSEAFSAIDVQLEKRYDLIPNILQIAQKYMEHEKTLLEEITNLRTQAMNLPKDLSNIAEKISLDTQIASKMGQFMVAVENYPDIKANQTMITAMQTYNEVEAHIAAARRFYNAAALELKNAVEIFPSSVLASMLNIKAVDFFKAEEQAKKAVSANDYLK